MMNLCNLSPLIGTGTDYILRNKGNIKKQILHIHTNILYFNVFSKCRLSRLPIISPYNIDTIKAAKTIS